MTRPFEGKRLLITGGTGSLGKTLARRLLGGIHGVPERIVVFSRDEAKQHDMRMAYLQRRVATDEVIYHNFERTLEFVIGDVRDLESVRLACQGIDVIFHAAALKQVPSCEYFPYEAVQTNVVGAENIVRALRSVTNDVTRVIGISTDKACKPVNVMGMTKALQERIFVAANVCHPEVAFICARYGNVLASRGSVIPLFHDQIRSGGPLTITDVRMTRFLLSLEDAVDTVIAAATDGRPGETFVPAAPAARITDIADALIGDRGIETQVTGIRPGEKLHESLISAEEALRTERRGDYYVILPMLSELGPPLVTDPPLTDAFSSDRFLVDAAGTRELLISNRLLEQDQEQWDSTELLR
jgi:UDP-glucose 4-epimerase